MTPSKSANADWHRVDVTAEEAVMIEDCKELLNEKTNKKAARKMIRIAHAVLKNPRLEQLKVMYLREDS